MNKAQMQQVIDRQALEIVKLKGRLDVAKSEFRKLREQAPAPRPKSTYTMDPARRAEVEARRAAMTKAKAAAIAGKKAVAAQF